ncbi:MAG: Asp23/Gls24 family envelope stress response protein [Clostridiales bacterium]|nr:Asp23/Gls24 family envelope stress response protein [Clostridiales bacterium]
MSNNEIKLRPTKGNITFNDHIILSVINLATKEIAGVSSLDTKHMFALKRWFNKNYSNGVKISYLNNSMIVDVYINVFFGYNVSEIAYRVQENIKNSIASMIDINIDNINVHVIGVDFSKSEDSDI